MLLPLGLHHFHIDTVAHLHWISRDFRCLLFPSLECQSGVVHHAAGPILATTEAHAIFTPVASVPQIQPWTR